MKQDGRLQCPSCLDLCISSGYFSLYYLATALASSDAGLSPTAFTAFTM
jgi:hypothetical protein